MQTNQVLQIFRDFRRTLLNETHINTAIKPENEILTSQEFVFH